MRGETNASKCVLGQNKHPGKFWRHTFFENFSPYSRNVFPHLPIYQFELFLFPYFLIYPFTNLNFFYFPIYPFPYFPISLFPKNYFTLWVKKCVPRRSRQNVFPHLPIYFQVWRHTFSENFSYSCFPHLPIYQFELFLFPYLPISLFGYF